MPPRSTRAGATRHGAGIVPGGGEKKLYLCKHGKYIYLNPNRRFPATESVMSLPPLDSLRFFEAAARHQSFVLAGKELGVTAATVGHRIRTLEGHLGAALFERRRRSVRLNRRGRAYLKEVQRILAEATASPSSSAPPHGGCASSRSRRWPSSGSCPGSPRSGRPGPASPSRSRPTTGASTRRGAPSPRQPPPRPRLPGTRGALRPAHGRAAVAGLGWGRCVEAGRGGVRQWSADGHRPSAGSRTSPEWPGA